MGLFSKKKKEEDLSTLSEKDIQKKLYGALRSENVTEPKPYTPAQKKESTATSVTTHPQEDSSPELFTELVGVEDSDYTNVVESDELVDDTAETEGVEIAPEEVVPEESKWTETEKKVIPGLTTDQPTSVYKPPTSNEAKEKKASFISKLLGFLGEASQLFLGGVVGILLLFDLRKHRVRRVFYILLIAAFVGLLFYGIHFLNVQRESAMREGAQSEISESAATTIPAEIQAQQPAAVENPTEASAEGPPVSGPVEGPKEPQPVEKKQEKKEPEPAPPAEPTLSPAELKPYVIQVATYAFRDDAERMSKKLQKEGINAFVKPLNRPNGKLYFCVFLGRFTSFSEANKALSVFKKNKAAKPFQDSFVRTLK